MLAELELIPLGTAQASVSVYVAKVAQLIRSSGLEHRFGAMGTVVEGDWDAIMTLARRCHEALLGDCDRVMTTIKIDDRKDQPGMGRMQQKLASLEAKLGMTHTP